MSLTHFAPATNLLWKYLESIDINPGPLYKKAGIKPELLLNPNARISISRVDELWQQAAGIIEDPCFAIDMAEFWHPSHMGALGYAWLASSTLRRGFNRAVRYIHVVTEDLNLEVADTPTGFKVSVDLEDSVFTLPQHHDLILTIIMHMCRFNFGEELIPTEVKLAHPEPACSNKIIDYFQTDVLFDAEHSSLSIARSDADLVLPSGNKQIALMHDEMLMRYLVEIKKGDIVQQVQSIILENLPDGQVTDQLVASQLNLSERSMQRRLKEHKTTFRFLLDGVREMVAKQYIENPMNRMSDIAFLLGFSEQSAFSRAFKKWTGKSPVEYRNSLN
ncbi:MAG: AraC family transcriptional regulator [Gammaproteobacteria bacterium]|nr:AraC family transcriptional regulator [Gammaproteobacteria bacterium]MBT8133983.1 AraC family transcriptional regulator [Gammaproteobacteria bacterium]NNJ49305.1 AraC family transcriptional regulator [Gammaproteobacteria bacterium]